MKKRLLGLSVLVLGLVCLTGCFGSKKLVCTISAGGQELELTTNFSGNKIKSMTLKSEMDLSSYSDAQIKMIEKQDLCSTFKGFMPYDFAKCDQKVSGKKYTMSATFDVASIPESEKTGSPKETKKELESQGYTCTLK